jgi:short-subunit dehydrogenase
LLLTARRTELLEDLAAETSGEAIRCDLADRSDLLSLCERLGEVDVLVANAGIGDSTLVHEATDDDIDQVIDVNLRAPIIMATRFAQAHAVPDGPGGPGRERGIGRHHQIVMIGSLSGMVATPDTRLYNATKFGLRGYSLALRLDLEDKGVGVSLVAPGFIRDAGMFADSDPDVPGFVRTKAPADVAAAVIKAIEKNPPEVYVSPVELRASASLGGLAPGLSERLQGVLGVRKYSGGKES